MGIGNTFKKAQNAAAAGVVGAGLALMPAAADAQDIVIKHGDNINTMVLTAVTADFKGRPDINLVVEGGYQNPDCGEVIVNGKTFTFKNTDVFGGLGAVINGELIGNSVSGTSYETACEPSTS